MENIERLFHMNEDSKMKRHIELNHNVLVIEIDAEDNLFTGIQIKQIINIINQAHKKYGSMKYSIHIFLGHVEFVDKLTYVFLECICYYLIEKYKHPVQIFMKVKSDISTKGIDSSPLLLLNGTKKQQIREFPNKFKFDIYRNHFRRVINGVGKEETNYLGELYGEIDTFLKIFSINDECRDEVGHVITELVDNVSEHAKTECLLDIDVAPYFTKVDKSGKIDDNYYYGINIAVLNFSEKLLGDDIHENILASGKEKANDRYKNVMEAYTYHKKFFSGKYTEEDFCNITTFQTKISGRQDKFLTGGTGLTYLIRSLEEKSENHNCYVISGTRGVNFFKDMLEYNTDKWVGFNAEKDYISGVPKEDTTTECFIYMPGTAYNFNFIMKGEKIDG